MQCLCCDADDADTQARVQEGLVEIFPLKRWHAAIFSCFAVEDEVCGEDRSTDDGSAVEEALG